MGKLVSFFQLHVLAWQKKIACKQVGFWTSWTDSEHYENWTKLLKIVSESRYNCVIFLDRYASWNNNNIHILLFIIILSPSKYEWMQNHWWLDVLDKYFWNCITGLVVFFCVPFIHHCVAFINTDKRGHILMKWYEVTFTVTRASCNLCLWNNLV